MTQNATENPEALLKGGEDWGGGDVVGSGRVVYTVFYGISLRRDRKTLTLGCTRRSRACRHNRRGSIPWGTVKNTSTPSGIVPAQWRSRSGQRDMTCARATDSARIFRTLGGTDFSVRGACAQTSVSSTYHTYTYIYVNMIRRYNPKRYLASITLSAVYSRLERAPVTHTAMPCTAIPLVE